MPDIKFFKDAQGKVYEVPTSKLDRFKQKYPNATEATQDELNMLESKRATDNEKKLHDEGGYRIGMPKVPSVEMPTAQDVQIGTSDHTKLGVTGGLEQKGMQGAIDIASQHHRADPDVQFRAKYGAYKDNPELHRDQDAPEMVERREKQPWWANIGGGNAVVNAIKEEQYGKDNQEDATTTRQSQEYLERVDKHNRHEEIDKLSDFLTNTEAGRAFVDYDDNVTKYFEELKPKVEKERLALQQQVNDVNERRKIHGRKARAAYLIIQDEQKRQQDPSYNPTWYRKLDVERAQQEYKENYEALVALPEPNDIAKAQEALTSLKNMMEAVNDRDKSAVEQFLGEIKRNVSSELFNTLTFGTKGMIEDATGVKGGHLTDKVMETTQMFAIINENLMKDQRSIAQDIAAGSMQTTGFILQMAMTSGLGKGIVGAGGKVLSKLFTPTTREIARRVAFEGAGKVISVAGREVSEVFVQTFLMPSTLASALERNAENPGHFLDSWSSAYKSAFVEVASERIGDFIPMGKFKSPAVNKIMKATHLNSIPVEWFEEQIGTVGHAVLGTGEGKWSDLTNKRNQLVTLGVVTISGMPYMAIESGGYAAGKYQAKKQEYEIGKSYKDNINDMQELFGDESQEVISLIEASLESMNEDMDAFETLVAAVANTEGLSEDQQNTILTFAMAATAKKGLERAKAESKISVANRVKSLVNKNVNKHTGTIIMADVPGMDSPVPIHGNIQFKPDGTIDHNKSGELYYKDADGKQKVTSSKYITLAETVDPAQIENDLAAQKELEIEKNFANRQVRPYQNGEQVKFTDQTGTIPMYGQVTGVDDKGNYIVSTQAGEVVIEPRQIVPEKHLEGVENNSEVKYINDKGRTVTGTVTDAFSMRNNGMMVIDGQEVSTDNIIGVVETKQYQPGQTISFTVPNAEGGTDTKTGTIVSINKDGRYEVKAEGQEQQMVVDPKFVDGEAVVAPKTEVTPEQQAQENNTEVKKADIDKINERRQKELFDILSEEDKYFALKIPEGDKRNKWVKARVSKSTKGSDVIERHNAEDALNASTDIATRIAAKTKLERNYPFNESSISDINNVILKIKNGDMLIGGEELIKDYYDAEIAALKGESVKTPEQLEAEKQQLAEQTRQQQEELEKKEFYDTLPRKQSGKDKGGLNHNQFTPEQKLKFVEFEYGKERAIAGAEVEVKNAEKRLTTAQTQLNNDPLNAAKIEAEIKAKEELDFYKSYVYEARRQQTEENKKASTSSIAEEVSKEKERKNTKEQTEIEAQMEKEATEGVPDLTRDKSEWARERGFRVANNVKYDRAAPVKVTKYVEAERKFTPNQKDQPKVIRTILEANQLHPSHKGGAENPMHFISEGQPKPRTDQASKNAREDIVKNVNPEEITGGVTAYVNSPIANMRGEIIQGNNRTDALQEMYKGNPKAAEKYKQHLIDNAEKYGMTAEEIAAMKNPIAVDIADVSDAEAIRLGQFTAADMESGGVEYIPAKQTVVKMGADIDRFVETLFKSDNPEASISDLIARNGADAVKYLFDMGHISLTQYQNAINKNGNLTERAGQDVRDIAAQMLFEGAADSLPRLFMNLPHRAQASILQTIHRDNKSEPGSRIKEEIQNAIQAYSLLEQSEEFKEAKTYKEATIAANAQKGHGQLFDSESSHPLEKYSNFAIELAILFKTEGQKDLRQRFHDFYDSAQGVANALFGAVEQVSLKEAIHKHFNNIDYVSDGQTQRTNVGDNTKESPTRQQTESGRTTTGESVEGEKRSTDSTGRVESDNDVKEKQKTVERISKQLNTEVIVYNTPDDIPSNKKDAYLEKKKASKGWYIGNKVYVVLSNHTNALDVQETLLHEIVGHKGIKDMLGREKHEQLLTKIFDVLPKEVQAELNEKYKGDKYIAADEYIAKLAENYDNLSPQDKTIWEKVKQAIINFIQNDLGIKLTEQNVNDVINALLVESKNRLENPAQFEAEIEAQKQAEVKQATPKSDYGSQNKIITQEQYTELRDKLRNKLNNLNTGFDPEIFSLGAQMAAYHIEAGAVKFKDFAQKMIADVGESVRPYLKSFYEGARLTPGFEQLSKQMDAHKDVVGADVDAIGNIKERLEVDIPEGSIITSTGLMVAEGVKIKSGSFEIDGIDYDMYLRNGSRFIVLDQVVLYETEAKNVQDAIKEFTDRLNDNPGIKANVKGFVSKAKQSHVDLIESEKREQQEQREAEIREENKLEKDWEDALREEEALDKAKADVDTNPTEAQKEAGNYKKGHVTIAGLDITIENPKGSQRSGTDANGDAWSITMQNDYGYIKQTKGKDGDHIDIFIGDNLSSDKVFVVDQADSKGNFDEHKVMLGFDTMEQAREAYLSNYEDGWTGLKDITETTVEDFKKWTDVDTKKQKAFAEYKQNDKAAQKTKNDTPINIVELSKQAAEKEKAKQEKKKEAEEATPEQPKLFEEQEQPKGKIEDFGEVIEGAKKHTYQRINVGEGDIQTQPLSKTFPKPDYKKLVEEGVLTKKGAMVLKHAYEALPNKPRKKYRLAAWVKEVEKVIATYNDLIENKEKGDKLHDMLSKLDSFDSDYADFVEIQEAFGFPENDVNMGAYRVIAPNKTSTSTGINKQWLIVKGQSIVGKADSVEGIVRVFNQMVDKNKKKGVKLSIYRDTITNKYFIGRKTGGGLARLVDGLTREEAIRMSKEEMPKLQEMWEARKVKPEERRVSNRKRVGTDYRQGKDVTDTQFSETFGFRGVQFGNWVNNQERQSSLNDAYDALMDMANVLGVSPRALSLAGELGMAFGARGSGGKNAASAHYEPGRVVINLTKRQGAGSLAHEWWHAMDNYFSRMRGEKSEFLTESPKRRIIGGKDGKAVYESKVRKEMHDAFEGVIHAIYNTMLPKRSQELDKTRSKAYWATKLEMSARAFEGYIIDKLGETGEQNDYLANFKETGEWVSNSPFDMSTYPYPMKEEAATINEAYKNFFETIQEKQKGEDVILFREKQAEAIRFRESQDFRDGHGAPAMDYDTLQEAIDEGGDFNLSEIITGKQDLVPSDYFDTRVATSKTGKQGYAGAIRYMYNTKAGTESLDAIKALREKVEDGANPAELKAKAYRAIPNTVDANKLIDGDWVSLSKDYVEKHGLARFGKGEYKIIEQDVPVNKLWWDGNDINELGYDTQENIRFRESDQIIEVTPFKYGEGGTKGTFKGKDGTIYKSLQGGFLDWEDGRSVRRYKDLDTQEYIILKMLEDDSRFPQVGERVETTEGAAFEIEELQKADNITFEEYLEVEKAIKELNSKGIYSNDFISVMRRPGTNEVVINDFSNGVYDASRIGNSYYNDVLYNRIEELLPEQEKAKLDKYKEDQRLELYKKLFPDEDIKREDIRFRQSDIPKLKEPFERVRANIENHISVKQNEFTNIDHDMSAEVKEKVLYGDIEDFGKYGRYEIVPVSNPILNIHNLNRGIYSLGVMLKPIQDLHSRGYLDTMLDYGYLNPGLVESFSRDFNEAIKPYEEALLKAKHLSTEAAQTEIMHIIKDIDHAKDYYERLAKDQSILRTEEAPRFREGDQTQTKEFKEWFGDSKVVDSEGRPMVMYHGGVSDFSVVDPNKGEVGFHIGTSRQANFVAHEKGGFVDNNTTYNQGTNIMPLYASIKNPLRLEDHAEFDAYAIIDQLLDKKHIEQEQYDEIKRIIRGSNNIDDWNTAVRNVLEKKGYDGIAYLNRYESLTNAEIKEHARLKEQKGRNLTDKEFKSHFPHAQDSYIVFNPNQVKSATGNIGTFDATNEDIRFRVREDAPPKKTEKGYKVFFLKDGKLYPPMVANKGGVETPVGVWLDAEAPEVAGQTKTGRPQVKQGGKGTQGGSGRLAYRPGWHLGEIPYAEQFNRKNPQTGAKELFPAQFVWAEVEYANDIDYQKDAESYGYTEKGKYRHSYAGLPTLPKDGSYRYRTNPNPSTDPWIITGSMKVNRVLTPTEVDQIVKDAGREPQMRQEGALTDADIQSLNSEQPLFRSSEEIEATKQVRQELDKVTWKFKTRLKEAWVDNFAQVKVLQDALKKNGLDIAEHNDYYLQATHIPGKVDARIEDYTNRYQKPLSKAIHDVQNKGVSHRNIENYVMLSEGLVRNERMRNEALDRWLEENPGADRAAQFEFIENLPEDYSGVLAIEEEVGMSAQEFIDEIEQEAGKDVISNLWAKINAATHYTLQKQYEAGFITKAEMEHYMENKKYVPLRGHDDVTAEDVYNYPSSMGVYFENPIKRADGRVSRAESPFAYIGQMAHSAIIQGVKNQHNQMLLRLSRLDKSGLITNSRSWEVNVGTKEKPVWMVETAPFDSDIDTYIQNQVDFEERMRELQEQGMARQSGSRRVDVGGLFIKPRQAEQHEVTVFENGVRHTLYINANPAIARAINESNKWHVGEAWGFVDQLLKINRQMAANFTTRDMRFIFTNFARDINMASTLIWAEQGGKQMVGFNKNLKPAFGTVKRHFTGKADLNTKNDAYFREFLMNGGMTGYYQLYELDRQAKKLEREAKKGDKRNALDRGKSVFNAIDIMNEVVENTTRFAAYMTARESGKSVVQSVHAAKNVSVNFNQKGAGTSVSKNAFEKALFSAAGAVIPSYLFSNANIQGMYRIYQATKGSPLKMGVAFGSYALAGLIAPKGTSLLSQGYIKAVEGAMAISALSWIAPVLASLVGGDDGEEEYMKQKEYDRQNNFTLMLPSGSFLKYPISHEFRLWYKLGDHAYQLLTGHEDAERAATEMMYAVSDLLPANPLGAFDASPAELAPDFARPFAQLGTNTDFKGSSIYNEWANPDVPGYLNAKTNKKGEPYAPDILVNFLKSVDHETGGDGVVKGKVSLNPDITHHFLRGFAGGLYTNIMQGISFGFEVYNAVNGEGFNLKAKDTPARAFYTSKDDLRFDSGTVNREYYDISRNASKTIGRANRYKKQYLEADINLQEYIEKIGKLDLTTANKQHEFIKEIKKMERQLPELQGKEQKDKELEIYQKKKELVELTK